MLKDPVVSFSGKRNKNRHSPLTNYILAEFRLSYVIIRNMENVATDIYSFRELRENGFTYVDKTMMLLPLCDLSIGKHF